jgi:hypothetical protein
MKTIALVGAVTAAGVVGGIAGALMSPPPCGHLRDSSAPAAPAAPAGDARAADSDLAKEVAALRAKVEELQAAATASSAETAGLRASLERQEKAAAESRSRLEAVEAAGSRPVAPMPVALSTEAREALGDRLRGRLAVLASNTDSVGRLTKSLELRMKPEEERWTAAREAIGLTAGQEEDLKAAIKERNQAIQDALKVTTESSGSDGNVAVRIASPDPEKMREARKAYDDRVNQVLSADQAKKWRDEGYDDAFGGGSRMALRAAVVEGQGEAPK